MTTTPNPRSYDLRLPSLGTVRIYAGARVRNSLSALIEDEDLNLTLYHGGKLYDVMEAVYEQGLKDGRHQVFEALSDANHELENRKELAHRPPGQPKKRAKKAPAGKRTRKAMAKKTPAKKVVPRTP